MNVMSCSRNIYCQYPGDRAIANSMQTEFHECFHDFLNLLRKTISNLCLLTIHVSLLFTINGAQTVYTVFVLFVFKLQAKCPVNKITLHLLICFTPLYIIVHVVSLAYKYRRL